MCASPAIPFHVNEAVASDWCYTFARVYSLLYLECLQVSQFLILGQRAILASPTPHAPFYFSD